MIKICILFTCIFTFSNSLKAVRAKNEHQYTWDVSKQISNSIKQVLLQNIDQFSDVQFRNQFMKDLQEPDDSKRVLKTLSEENAKLIFRILKVKYPGCDPDGNHVIEGKQLKCLNLIWKVFLPS